jgi:hypothetical protein
MHIGIGHKTKTSMSNLARFIMTLDSQTWVNLWKELRKGFANIRLHIGLTWLKILYISRICVHVNKFQGSLKALNCSTMPVFILTDRIAP